jgi:ankyrin repeat protein
MHAARHDAADSLGALLEAGADPNAATITGATVLMMAASNGANRVVQRLLELGVEINARDSRFGSTALTWAVGRNHVQTVETLLRAGADPNIGDNAGRTPLMLSATRGNVDIVNLLLQAGAKIDAKDSGGNSVMDWAMHNKRGTKVQELLRKAGASGDATS